MLNAPTLTNYVYIVFLIGHAFGKDVWKLASYALSAKGSQSSIRKLKVVPQSIETDLIK